MRPSTFRTTLHLKRRLRFAVRTSELRSKSHDGILQIQYTDLLAQPLISPPCCKSVDGKSSCICDHNPWSLGLMWTVLLCWRQESCIMKTIWSGEVGSSNLEWQAVGWMYWRTIVINDTSSGLWTDESWRFSQLAKMKRIRQLSVP